MEISPVIHISGNTTIYSVPEPTPIYIKCRDLKSPTRSRDDTVTLEGIGEISFQQGCAVTLPKGQKFKIPINLPHQVLPDSNLYNLLKIYPQMTNIVITTPDTTNTQLDKLDLHTGDTPNWEEFTYNTFHPSKSMPFLTQFALAVS